MPFYDSVHTGYWRVSLNEQYIWSWLRENDVSAEYGRIDVARVTCLVEDELNIVTFNKPIDVSNLVRKQIAKLYPQNDKPKS